MKRLILIVLMLVSVVSGADLQFGVGKTYTSWTTLVNALNPHDTITLAASTDSTYTITSNVQISDLGVLVRSNPGTRQTISCPITGGVTAMTLYADSIKLKNIKFLYPLGTSSGTNRMVASVSSSNKWEAFQFDSIDFVNENQQTSNLRSIQIRDGHSNKGTTWNKCTWKNFNFAIEPYTTPNDNKGVNMQNVIIDSCLFDSSKIFLGHKWQIKNSLFIGSVGENVVADSCDSILLENCYTLQRSGGAEMWTFDDLTTSIYSKKNIIRNSGFDSITHVISLDQQDSSEIYNNIFIRRPTDPNGFDSNSVLIYFHDATTPGKDTRFRNNSFANGGDDFLLLHNYVSGGAMTGMDFSKNLWLSGAGIVLQNDNAALNSFDSSIMGYSPTITNLTVSDTIVRSVKSFLIDTTTVIPLLKSNFNDVYGAGLGKMMYVSTPTDTSESGFSVPCSLNVFYRHLDHERLAYNNYKTNRWFTGDTADVVLSLSSDKSTFTPYDTFRFKNGTSGLFTVTGQSAGTKIYYRFNTVPVSTGTSHIFDTTFIDSITTLSSEPQTPDSTIYFEHDMDDIIHPEINGLYMNNVYTTFDSTVKHNGVASMKVHAIGNDGGNQGTGLDIDQFVVGSLVNKVLCMQAWLMIDTGFSWGTASPNYVKLFRMLDSENTYAFWTGLNSDNKLILGETSDASLPESYEPGGVDVHYRFDTINDNRWRQITVYQKFESSLNASDGEFKLYVDSVLIDSVGGLDYVDVTTSASIAWGGILCAPYFQLNGTANDGGDWWIDDVKTANYMLPMTAYTEAPVTPKTPATITVQPVSDTVVAGQLATFFVTATSDSAITYQWYRNDSLIAGATNDTFTYTSRTGLSYVDNVYCALTTDTTINSDTVQLVVNGVVFKKDVLFIGNSRTSGIPDSVAQQITSGLGYSTFANRGHGGKTTIKFLEDLPIDLSETTPTMVVLCDLLNDYLDWQRNGTERKLDSILLLCKQSGVTENNFIFVQAAPTGLTNDSIMAVLNNGPNSLSKAKKVFSYEYDWAVRNRVRFAQWRQKAEDYRLTRIDKLDSAITWVTTDEVHFNDSGYVLFKNAVLASSVLSSKHILWGKSGYAGSWKTWILSSATKTDEDTGSITISATNGYAASPVMHIGHYQKTITLTPSITGNYKLQYRDAFWDFKRNASAPTWVDCGTTITTKKNFFQFRVVSNDGSVVITSIDYAWSNRRGVTLDTLYFGNRDGMIKGWHKDASVYQGDTDRSYGDQPNIAGANTASKFYGLIRFNYAYDIPSNAIIKAANLHLFDYQNRVSGFKTTFRELKTDYGATREWDEFGQNPSQYKQGAWYAAQADTVSPVFWAGGGSISSADFGDTVAVTTTTAMVLGQERVVDITQHIQKNVGSYDYTGLIMSDTNSVYARNFWSQNNTTSVNYRPYLEVIFSVPSTTGSRWQNFLRGFGFGRGR